MTLPGGTFSVPLDFAGLDAVLAAMEQVPANPRLPNSDGVDPAKVLRLEQNLSARTCAAVLAAVAAVGEPKRMAPPAVATLLSWGNVSDLTKAIVGLSVAITRAMGPERPEDAPAIPKQ